MKKKGLQIDGQICFDLNTNSENYVVQANELIEGKQNLKLNSAKIIRALIMQIRPDDDELKSYVIGIPELSKMLDVRAANLYRDIDSITDDILTNHVAIKDRKQGKFIKIQWVIPELSKMLDVRAANLYRDIDSITDDILTNHVAIKDRKQGKFIKIQWVTACAYEKGVGLAVKMNPLLKPFLLNLQAHYTQYELENILAMKSIYAIRIYELIQKEHINKRIPKDGTYIVLTVKEIREACCCENKYEKISQFKAKVLDVAVREIQRTTAYTISYDCIKKGRTIESIRFFVNLIYH